MTAPRTWSAEASVEHARRVGHLTARAATPESLARLLAVRDLLRETADRVQESIDLAAAELADGDYSLQELADLVSIRRSTVQGYVDRGRSLVQEEDAAPVEPVEAGLARDGAGAA